MEVVASLSQGRTAAAQCGFFTYKSVPVIFEPPCIYKTMILSVFCYGFRTWCVTLREKRRLRLFENRVLRRIFGPQKDDVTEEWRRLNNMHDYDLCPSPNIIRVIKSQKMR